MYNVLVVGGFEVEYRHRDTYDRVKVSSVKMRGREVDLPLSLDDCSGEEFFQLLTVLSSCSGDVYLANSEMESQFS
jgi:hypothetical protein